MEDKNNIENKDLREEQSEENTDFNILPAVVEEKPNWIPRTQFLAIFIPLMIIMILILF